MWLDDFQIQHIELPFKDPIKVGNEIIKQKKSLYLTLNFSNKKSGTGEISLLPGLIDLSPKEAIEEVNLFLLPLLKKKIEGIDKPIKESDLKINND